MNTPHDLRERVEAARQALYELELALKKDTDCAAIQQARATVESVGEKALRRFGKVITVHAKFQDTCRFSVLVGETIPTKSQARNVLHRRGAFLETRIERLQQQNRPEDRVRLRKAAQELAALALALEGMTPGPTRVEVPHVFTPRVDSVAESDLVEHLRSIMGD